MDPVVSGMGRKGSINGIDNGLSNDLVHFAGPGQGLQGMQRSSAVLLGQANPRASLGYGGR